MHRIDRALGILLLLRDGASLSAAGLARRFEVSKRTIYRDVETLGMIGVPVYAARGREGGFRLMEGYFLPPVMFSRTEAVSLLMAVTMLRSLRARPFPAELETAEEKLLAAMPGHLRRVLSDAHKVLGAEAAPTDPFHPEAGETQDAPPASGEPGGTVQATAESHAVSAFLQGILDRRLLSLRYRSPYRANDDRLQVEPLGIFWDRNRWYLVGRPGHTQESGATGNKEGFRFWRADRVLELRTSMVPTPGDPAFDVREQLDRKWLGPAMRAWAEESPVRLLITCAQWERLKTDWYYQHARYEQQPGGEVLMTFGEDNREVLFDLLRWLGPGAELIEPSAWRADFRTELEQMLEAYRDDRR
jgi:predicted DNA-binding transcriptional regulator YafY